MVCAKHSVGKVSMRGGKCLVLLTAQRLVNLEEHCVNKIGWQDAQHGQHCIILPSAAQHYLLVFTVGRRECTAVS